VPALLGAGEAKDAYDRLAAARFREHECETEKSPPAATQNAGPTFADRARLLIMRGFKPKDAVELVLKEVALEHRNDPEVMEKARGAAEAFLQRIRKGLL
jgi:hypothetical protein